MNRNTVNFKEFNESDILFQAVSNCNSGTKSYSECRKNAELQSLYF